MNNEVVFQNLACGASINGVLAFDGGRFIADPQSSTLRPDRPGVRYANIIGIAIDTSSYPEDLDINSIIIAAYRFAIDIFTSLTARHQTYAYLNKPIKCMYQGLNYVLVDDRFELESEWNRTHAIYGGDHVDSINFLNSRRNPRRILHFYREARDETNPIDYRVLQLWRFFEGWFGLQGGNLVDAVVNIDHYDTMTGFDVNTHQPRTQRTRIYRRFVNSFYRSYRSAVAHGGGRHGGHSRMIHYPRLLHLYSNIWEKLDDMLEIAGEVLRRSPRRLN